eukprot:scaffold438774_cov19-Prasinocladus_malaysianus.AAC.1
MGRRTARPSNLPEACLLPCFPMLRAFGLEAGLHASRCRCRLNSPTIWAGSCEVATRTSTTGVARISFLQPASACWKPQEPAPRKCGGAATG